MSFFENDKRLFENTRPRSAQLSEAESKKRYIIESDNVRIELVGDYEGDNRINAIVSRITIDNDPRENIAVDILDKLRGKFKLRGDGVSRWSITPLEVYGGQVLLQDIVLLTEESFSSSVSESNELSNLIAEHELNDESQEFTLEDWLESNEFRQYIKNLGKIKGDLKPTLLFTYDQLENTVNESLVYAKKAALIHKQAIQNAVDIIQSKRISFLEAGKDPYWEGIFVNIALMLFIDLTIAGIASGIAFAFLKGLSKYAPKMTAKITGANTKTSPTLTNNINTLAEKIRQNKKKTDRLAIEKRERTGPRFIDSKYDPAKTVEAVFQLSKLIKDKKAERSRMRSNLRGLKKEERKQAAHSLSKFLSEKAETYGESFVVKSVSQVAKGASSTAIPKTKNKYLKATVQKESIPVDVAMKIYVQSIWDDEIWKIEQILNDIKATRKNIEYFSDSEAELQVQATVDAVHAALNLEYFADELKPYFQELSIGRLAEHLTSEYELRLWVILYGESVARHTALGLFSRPTRTSYFKDDIFPITQEKYDSIIASKKSYRYEEYWRTIARDKFKTYQKKGFKVRILANETSAGSKKFFEYMRNRFFKEDISNDIIAKELADMNARLQEALKLSEQDKSSEQGKQEQQSISRVIWKVTEATPDISTSN